MAAEWHFDKGAGSVLGEIEVSSSHYFTADSKPEAREIVVPGFGVMVAIIGLLAAYLRRIGI